MRRLVLLACALIVGCNISNPDADRPLFVVSVLSPSGGTFTALGFNAFGAGGGTRRTYNGTGSFQEVLRLSSGSPVDTSLQEIRGTYTGDSLIVGFGTRLEGSDGLNFGALAGSLQAAEGPHLQTLSCRVRYGASGASGSTGTPYRVTFRLTTDRARTCASP